MLTVPTFDFHTAGEPFRIVAEGQVELPGATVGDRRERAIASEEAQALRRLLCLEPRGHAGMYGGFVVPPDDSGADVGVLFWHRAGFSTACGHGSIALAVWAVEHDLVSSGDGTVTLDVPSGRVVVRVRCEGGRPASAVFRNVPAYVIERGLQAPSADAEVDLAFAGAIYASLPAAALGLSVTSEDLGGLIDAAAAIRSDERLLESAQHSADPRLSGIYGVIFHDAGAGDPGRLHQRNVTVFADGEVDRSPCGSGSSARAALLVDEGMLELGGTLVHESIVGTRFTVTATEAVAAYGRDALVTEVSGMAYPIAASRFLLDPADPLADGFLLGA